MADSFQVLFGDPAQGANDAFYNVLTSLEVEENADLPGAIQLTIPISAQDSGGTQDLSGVGDALYAPYAKVAVVATADGQTPACIFDGHVLAHKIQLERGTTSSSLRVWGQDVTCLMNVKETVKEWKSKTDGEIATDIFKNVYGFAVPTASPKNTDDDSPKHEDAKHTLMQRATDAQFLRDLARRNGKLFRVCCDDKAGKNTGYFVKPSLSGDPVTTLTLNPADTATIDALTIEWDVARPSQTAAQVLIDKKDAENGDLDDAGLPLLDQRGLGAFIGDDKRKTKVVVTSAVDTVTELKARAAALLRESGWFVRCEGEADLSRARKVLRAGTVIRINGAGKLHSGKYLVWSVRHSISQSAHRMKFVLVRNAVGSAS